jgi:hypothetical protein
MFHILVNVWCRVFPELQGVTYRYPQTSKDHLPKLSTKLTRLSNLGIIIAVFGLVGSIGATAIRLCVESKYSTVQYAVALVDTSMNAIADSHHVSAAAPEFMEQNGSGGAW